jgi:hypothetical protein
VEEALRLDIGRFLRAREADRAREWYLRLLLHSVKPWEIRRAGVPRDFASEE